MKKLFLIFGFMFAFVLGTNTVNAQERKIRTEADLYKFNQDNFSSLEKNRIALLISQAKFSLQGILSDWNLTDENIKGEYIGALDPNNASKVIKLTFPSKKTGKMISTYFTRKSYVGNVINDDIALL